MVYVPEDRLFCQFDRIALLNQAETRKHDGNKDVVAHNHFRHLVEEVGEVACCLRGKNDETLANEAVDAAICAISLALLNTDDDIESFMDAMESKLDKWESRTNLKETR